MWPSPTCWIFYIGQLASEIFKFESVDGRRWTDGGPLVYYKFTLWAFGSGKLKMFKLKTNQALFENTCTAYYTLKTVKSHFPSINTELQSYGTWLISAIMMSHRDTAFDWFISTQFLCKTVIIVLVQHLYNFQIISGAVS